MSETGFYSLKADLPGGKVFDFADLKGKNCVDCQRCLEMVSALSIA